MPTGEEAASNETLIGMRMVYRLATPTGGRMGIISDGGWTFHFLDTENWTSDHQKLFDEGAYDKILKFADYTSWPSVKPGNSYDFYFEPRSGAGEPFEIYIYEMQFVYEVESTGSEEEEEEPEQNIGAQNATAKFEAGIPISVAHRAAWRVAPENSLLAIAASINMGIDANELDVKITSDGVVVLMHDSTIDRTTEGSGNVESMTWEELKTYAVENGTGNSDIYTLTEEDVALLKSLPNYVEHCGEPVVGGTMPTTRLDDAIDLMNMLGPNTMINLDYCTTQNRFVNCYIMFRENDMLDNVLFKNTNSVETANTWYAAAAEAWNVKYPDDAITATEVRDSILYVYIIKSDDYSPLQEHLDNNENLVMTEVVISDDATDAAIKEKLEPWCKENGVGLFINTMWEGLCSTKGDTETTWAEMIDRGYTAIQTDRPSSLAYYLYDFNRTRASTETIQAEHFNLFNYDSYGLNVPAACDSDLNKKLNNMNAGDWTSYNMSFNGDESILNLMLQVLNDSAELNIYLDAINSDNLIATVQLGEPSSYQTVSAEITGTITEGEHTLYIQAMGLPNTPLVSMDNFTFVPSDCFEGEKSIEYVKVTTESGVAPVLPSSVNVTVGEATYDLSVRWERIDSESYAEEGTFTVLGYIPLLKTYITAEVDVVSLVPNIAEENLSLWLDASEGVTAEDGVVTKWTSKVGDITANISSGSPALVTDAIGGQQGIYFDGNSYMELNMPENFWNKTDAEYTVLMYVSSDETTSGNGSTVSGASNRDSQKYSVMWFKESASWGGVYFTASQNEVIWRFGSGTDGDRGITAVRPMDVGKAYNSTAIRKDGSVNTVFADGVKIYTGASASSDTVGTGSAGYIGQGQYGNYAGTICQILIYDTALTDEQIVAAQRWMAEKYVDEIVSVESVEANCEVGTAPELPASLDATYESGTVVALGVTWESINPNNYMKTGSFTVNGTLSNGMTTTATVTVTAKTPVEISEDNILLWFSAQEGLTADSDGNVSAWLDKKTDTVKAAQATTDNQPTIVYDDENNVDGIYFDGSDKMTFDAGQDTFNGYEGITMVVYSKPDMEAPMSAINKNHVASVVYFGEYSAGWSGLYFGTYKNGAAGRIGTGTSNYRGILYTSGSYSDYTTTVLRKNGTSNDELIINGYVISNTTSTGTASGSKTQYIDGTTGVLGYGKEDTGWTGEKYWKGTVSEIIIFNKNLTDGELESVYTYLDQTYGTNASHSVSGIYLKEADTMQTLYVDDTMQLTACVVPDTASNSNMVWKSSNTDVATVDENGLVTAYNSGKTIITVTTDEGGFSASCVIQVNENSNDILWQDIQNLRNWAATQEPTDYINWDSMEEALTATVSVTVDSSLKDLTSAYETLRDALIGLVERLSGDLDSDGKIDANDLTLMRQVLLSIKDSDVADVNGDGYVDVRDLVRLKKICSNLV